MFKQISLSLAALALLSACSVKEDRITNCKAPVTICVNPFSITQEPFTKATHVGEYSGVRQLTLAFYAPDGTEVYQHSQAKGNLPEGETFGTFSTTLPLGSYTMVVLGFALYGDDELTLTSPTEAEYTVNAPRETFAATQAVNVTGTAALNLSATLDRIVSKLQVVSTDGKTANVTNVRMTFSAGGRSFNPTTGLATSNTGFTSTVGNSAAAGATSSSIGYLFLATDEQTMDVTIETLDSGGNTIFSKTVTGVPFKRNRATVLTGALYSASASGSSFELNTAWATDYTGTF